MFNFETLVVLSLPIGAADGSTVLHRASQCLVCFVDSDDERRFLPLNGIKRLVMKMQCACCEVRTHCLKAVYMRFLETNAPCCVDKHQTGAHLEVAIVVNRIRELTVRFDRDLNGGEPRIPVTCKAPVPTKVSDGHSASIFTVNRDIVFVRNVVTTYQTPRCHKPCSYLKEKPFFSINLCSVDFTHICDFGGPGGGGSKGQPDTLDPESRGCRCHYCCDPVM